MLAVDIEHDQIGIRRGEMEKDILDMTSEEREVYYARCAEKAKQYLFSINMPLVYQKNGKTIAEFADGSITTL
ncbi:hypothetical protein [Fibrella aquatilis]|uniref:Uncharacterized protein n=1 Tax=Fibrella aquatilis TaxID=2817059 RepID=A0A939JZL1_9BACT|nr:hypothetical protein [Fibrella aquatilis]MBO0931523.1 hypothetical protein [Fibrella aquatilis]